MTANADEPTRRAIGRPCLEDYLAREREAADRRMLSFMPDGPNGNGDQSQ